MDFILLKNHNPIPIEVKSKLANLEMPKGIKRFLARYKDVKTAYVINEDLSGAINNNPCQVKFLTFEEFSRPNVFI